MSKYPREIPELEFGGSRSRTKSHQCLSHAKAKPERGCVCWALLSTQTLTPSSAAAPGTTQPTGVGDSAHRAGRPRTLTLCPSGSAAGVLAAPWEAPGQPHTGLGQHNLLGVPTGDGGLVNYRILSGAEGKFEIDESTGLIITVDYLDYETKASYLMNVSATDQAPPFNQGFCSVYVTLLNELDEAVQFSNASYEAAILENLALGTEIVRVQAYSIDNLNQITYRFDAYTSTQAKALFKIDSVTVRETGSRHSKGSKGQEAQSFYS